VRGRPSSNRRPPIALRRELRKASYLIIISCSAFGTQISKRRAIGVSRADSKVKLERKTSGGISPAARRDV
jgi:hypothetical protein